MIDFTSGDMMTIIFLGIGIVFCVLTIIYALMVAMRVVFYDMPRKKANEGKMQTAQNTTQIKPQNPENDEEEIVAVLTVIAAAMNTDVKNIRLNSLTEAWQPTFKNNLGGNANEKLYSKDKWKNI